MPVLRADLLVPAEPVEHAELGKAQQPALGHGPAGEREAGQLAGGEHLVLIEQVEQVPVPEGEAAEHGQRVTR